LDYIGKIQSYPPPGVKCEFTELAIQGGGPVGTALVALARWGIPGAICGMIGDDSFGRRIQSSLAEEGIDTAGLAVRKGCESQFAFIAAEPGVGRRTIFWRRPSGSGLHPDDIDYAGLRQARIYHTDGLFTEAALAGAREARKAGIEVSVDAGTLREGMLDLARLSDYFIASETFANALSGVGQAVEACRKLSELGPRVVGVTLGSRGSVALANGTLFRKRAYEVTPVDTTGCGDVFHAGFIFGIIRKWDLDKTLDFASWSAAMVSLELGGRKGIPGLKEIEEKGF
jgi:sulfofructose kinase